MTDTPSIRVDIVSDVVCPWCVIGYRQLERAAQATGIDIDLHWHPFELNPQMEEAGENLAEHLRAKYGTTPAQSREARERLTQLGADLGFAFDYGDDMRMWNTFRAHQLIDWANDQGRAHDLEMALFEAFFTRHADLSDTAVLADIAAGIGLDRAAALALLESGERAEAVREKERFWTGHGISGVPAMIFEERHLVTGAQGEETYASILRQLTSARTA